MDAGSSTLAAPWKKAAPQFKELWRNDSTVDEMKLLMAHFAVGRVVLHVGCLIRGGKAEASAGTTGML